VLCRSCVRGRPTLLWSWVGRRPPARRAGPERRRPTPAPHPGTGTSARARRSTPRTSPRTRDRTVARSRVTLALPVSASGSASTPDRERTAAAHQRQAEPRPGADPGIPPVESLAGGVRSGHSKAAVVAIQALAPHAPRRECLGARCRVGFAGTRPRTRLRRVNRRDGAARSFRCARHRGEREQRYDGKPDRTEGRPGDILATSQVGHATSLAAVRRDVITAACTTLALGRTIRRACRSGLRHWARCDGEPIATTAIRETGRARLVTVAARSAPAC
jgi:hypothetical protein